MYQIDTAQGRSRAPRMSAFPRHVRPFTEPVTASQDVVIGEGKTLPELIRLFYPGATPKGFSANFGFLDRDNKERKYSPGTTDPYVFKNIGSLREFSDEAKRLLGVLCKAWTELGLPLVRDKDREVDVPDAAVAMQRIGKDRTLQTRINDIYFIVANADIMKKACVVRTVNPGWWAVSYAGRNAPNLAFFKMSLSAHKRAVNAIMRSDLGRRKFAQLWAEAGDPLFTNPGYPFFTAQVDASGYPVTRIKTVELFSGLVSRASRDWTALLSEVDRRAGKFGMEGHPFCVAPLRRLQPGYKWQHQFTQTPSGLVSAFDERGVNSQRVAHMVPYAYNVITAPVSTMYKTVRYFLPGCYHDGSAKQRRMAMLAKQAKTGELWLAEADYSNFDRFMPVDLIEQIVKWFTDATGDPSFWHPAMMYLHNDASLVWPDYNLEGRGFGWLFKAGRLGLLSGVKATSETGTLVNSVVNGEALARAYGWSEDQLYSYLTQYLSADIGSRTEYFYVQSDDTQLISKDPVTLQQHATCFMEAVQAAGLKGSVELADRFLMRHTQQGCDRPVPARVWQNTLSNETPVEDELIFLAGLAARTDGLFGAKSVDPFQTGAFQRVSLIEAEFTRQVVLSLRKFISSASRRSVTAVRLLDALASYGSSGSRIGNEIAFSDRSAAVAAHDIRRAVTIALAKRQEEELKKMDTKATTLGAVNKWLYELHKDQFVPSSQLVIDELTSGDPRFAAMFQKFVAQETAFFRYAFKTISGYNPFA